MGKKMENITLEDVKNMKFDPPLKELDIFIGISARAQRDGARKAIEEEEGKKLIFPTQEPLGENPVSGSSIDISRDERTENEKSLFKKPADKGKRVMVEGNLAFDERERLKEMREKSILRRGGSWCGTRGERVMGEKTTPIKNPDGTTAGKKMKVMPRDLTKEDTKDLKSKLYSSAFDFDLLVDIGMKSRKLYKEEAKKLMIPQSESEEEEDQEEEPSNEDHTPIFPSLLDISEKQNKRSLINNAYVEKGKEKFSTSPRGEEDFCCPTPEAAAKRQRMLMRENCLYIPGSSTSLDISKGERLMAEKSLKKPAVIDDENPERGFVNKQSWFESNNNKGIIIEEEGAFRVMKRTTTSNNKGFMKWVNDGSLDDYKPDLPEFIMDKIRNENGSDVKLVIQKQLTPTDLVSGQNRISLPFNALNRTDFLTIREQEYLNGRRTDAEGKKSENAEQKREKKGRRPDRNKNKNGIHVVFIEPNGDRNLELVFKRWDMPKNGGQNVSSMYLFNGKWKDVYKKHDLDACMIVQVWSFRYNGGELGFAMVIVGRVENEDANRNRNRNRKRNKNNSYGNGHGSSESGSGNGNGNGSGMGASLEW
ncbi:hypothetical protein RHMOL_Rhmol06G0285400 [Rhododendron molle]|uniref:Uncharacterized protein n=1 Tax=Rhododendron molle TaxID=49168 RepID=A0ACC0NII8_RHOML|nr:hypothetical protein RHMOL_Rhmol06G0285400 [Rhododendron molle]